MAALDVNQKADIYETLSSLNLAFAGIVQHLQTLQRTGLFKSKTAKLFPSFTQELQAEFNQEFLEDLQQLDTRLIGLKIDLTRTAFYQSLSPNVEREFCECCFSGWC